MDGRRALRYTERLAAVLLIAAIAALAAMAQPCAAGSARAYLARPDDWFRGQEGRRVTANVLSWQSPHGSWPKNTDTMAKPFDGDPKTLQGTFDNGATTDELRFLARAYRATKSPRCHQAFLKGLAHNGQVRPEGADGIG